MSSDAPAILADLASRGLIIRVIGDKLRVHPPGLLTPDEAQAIRDQKLAIIALLTERSRPSCHHVHNDKALWSYAPDQYRRPGWRIVTCRLCGGFVGYQPPAG